MLFAALLLPLLLAATIPGASTQDPGLNYIPGPDYSRLPQPFEVGDKDGDGCLTFEEYLFALNWSSQAWNRGGEETVGDGHWTLERIRSQFEKMDQDESGCLTVEEYEADLYKGYEDYSTSTPQNNEMF